VITATDEIVMDAPVVGVAVSTLVREPLPADHIELPWHIHGHPSTGLRKRSVAVCRWLVEVHPSDLEPTDAYVPSKTLLRILESVRDVNG